MLVSTIYNAEQLQDEFIRYDRDYFSLDGYQALIDLFDEVDCGKPTELDVIAICCDFTEDEPANIAKEYGIDLSECEDEGEVIETVLNFLNCHSFGQELGNGNILYTNF